MKAWHCNTKDGFFPSVVFAATRGRARYLMALSASDASYDYAYLDMTAKRSQEHDWVAQRRDTEMRPHCYLPALELAKLLRIEIPDEEITKVIQRPNA